MSGVLGLLGLGFRGGKVVAGVDRVREGLQQGKFPCVVVAADASPRAVEKVVRLARGRGIRVITVTSAAALGATLGKPPVMVAGVRDAALAAGLARASSHRS